VKRITKFLEQKSFVNITLPKPEEPKLSTKILPNIDIFLASENKPSKILSVTRQPTASILPKPKKLSFQKFFTTEIVPGSKWEDAILLSSYINGGTLTTTFVCHICHNDYTFKSADAIQISSKF
jgi:hypothetical protein